MKTNKKSQVAALTLSVLMGVACSVETVDEEPGQEPEVGVTSSALVTTSSGDWTDYVGSKLVADIDGNLTWGEGTPLACADRYAIRSIECSGTYCSKIRIRCDSAGGHTPKWSKEWLPWVSEETPAQYCPTDKIAVGIKCTGRSCAQISVQCAYAHGYYNDGKLAYYHTGTRDSGVYAYASPEEGPTPEFDTPLLSPAFLGGVMCAGPRCGHIGVYRVVLYPPDLRL